METHTKTWQRWLHSVLALVLLVGTSVPYAHASSWDPTLLVNTESFVEIDEGDGTTDVELYFGTTERLYYDRSEDSFVFTKGLTVNGTVTGSSLAATDLAGCTNVTSDANGQLICDDLSGLDARYVNVSGDTMTGALQVNSTIGATGDISTDSNLSADGNLTIDADDSGTPTLSFGTAESLSFTTGQFVFTDDLNVTGDLDVDGNTNVDGTLDVAGATVIDDTLNATGAVDFDSTLNVDGTTDLNDDVTVTGNVDVSGDVSAAGTLSGNALTVDTGSVTINGVTYNVTNTQGGANTVLTNDGSGNLTWQSSAIGNGSGSFMSLHAEYPNATYKGDGTANTGKLYTDVIANQNYYIWNTSKAAAQDYDVYVRVQVPENFDSWASIEVQHNNAGAATVQADLIDTTGATQTGTATGGTGIITITPSGTYTAGEYMTVRIRMTATSAGDARLGYLNLNWVTTTP